MAAGQAGRVFHQLVIQATDPNTEIWLGDDLGHFVQKAIATLDTSLLAGNCTVEFGLGAGQYPVQLMADSRFTQADLAKGANLQSSHP